MKKKGYIKLLILLSILAMAVSVYLVYQHYKEGKAFCDINERLSCDIVNKSVYSVFPPYYGIPVSIMGLATFFVISLLAVLALKKKTVRIAGRRFGERDFIRAVTALLIASIGFALYLVYIELFILYAVCPMCVVLDVLIVISLVIALKILRMGN